MLYLKQERRSSILPLTHEYQLMPILKIKYHLTGKTALKMGIQGFPFNGLYYRFEDLNESNQSFRRQSRTLLLTNQSEYYGYQIVMSVGLMYDNVEYLEARQRGRNSKITSMFMRVLLGYD
jgi:hypothetical protein